jgi:hypothetical protein
MRLLLAPIDGHCEAIMPENEAFGLNDLIGGRQKAKKTQEMTLKKT